MEKNEKLKSTRHWSENDEHNYDRALNLFRDIILEQQKRIEELEKSYHTKEIKSSWSGLTGTTGPTGFASAIDNAPEELYRSFSGALSKKSSADPFESFNRGIPEYDEDDEYDEEEVEGDVSIEDILKIDLDAVPSNDEIKKYVQTMYAPENRKYAFLGAEWMRKKITGI